MKKHLLFILFVLSMSHLQAQVSFTKITEGAIVNTLSDSRSANFVDFNQDGWEDIFISNGPEDGENNMLYKNNGDGTFTQEMSDIIVMDASPSDGATFADADNDGDLDAFVVTWHGHINYYYQNNGNGSFTYLPEILTANTGTYSETASWGDYDNDGLVDIFITNSYINLHNMLFKNLGNQTFSRITTGAPITENEPSRSVQWADYDGDGKIDLFISNESNRKNTLYHNDGAGEFTKITNNPIVEGSRASMSSSWGDVNNDGHLDLFVANAGYFQEQNNQLFINQGDGTFEAVTQGDLVTQGGCSYGSAFADVDNDGHLDLLVANGFCNNNLADYLYLNDGNGNFTRDLTSLAALENICSFGCAWGDYDKNGFLDLIVAQCQNNPGGAYQANTLFKNDGNGNHWLQIKLEGTLSNRSAIGAVIRVKANIDNNDIWQMRHISAQSGYCGQNSLIAHFGLGDATVIDSLIVEWPSGIQTMMTDQSIDQQLFILEEPNTSVQNNQVNALDFDFFPSPTNGYLEINMEGLNDKDLELKIVDSLGRVPLTKIIKTNGQVSYSLSLNLTEARLSPGVYYLYLKNGKQVGLRSFSFLN